MKEDLKLDAPVPGFRKGITKKSLLKSMTDDDWVRVDQAKEAETRESQNEYAFKLFVYADQARNELENIKRNIKKSLFNILALDRQIHGNEVEILAERTEQKDNEGKSLEIEDLKLFNLDLETKAESYLAILRTDCSRLFRFVGSHGLDRKIMFTEDEFNERIKYVSTKLENTKFKLFS